MSSRRPAGVAVVLAAVIALTLGACGDSAESHLPSATASTTSTPVVAPSLLPEPTGPHAVGVRVLDRVSPQSASQLWYPAVPGSGGARPDYMSAAWARSLGVTVEQLRSVRVRARVDATPAPAATPRPGVVLMPGWAAPMALSTALAQDLASHGYVVVTVDPGVGTEDPTRLPADLDGRLAQLTRAVDFLSGPAVTAVAGPVDATRIAAGGHSIAGAVAFQASLTDDRLRAVFNTDGWLHGIAVEKPVTVPALAVDASGFDEPTAAVLARSATAVTVKLEGATHFDVTDLPCLAPALGPAAAALQLGTIGCTGSKTTTALVVRFLESVLRTRLPAPPAATLASGLQGIR